MVIIDTGASNNTLNAKKAKKNLSKFVEDTAFELEFDTANGTSTADAGMRVRVGAWDANCDYVLMDDSLELISVGERTMCCGFSFLWVTGKQPCFISHGGKHIVIFEIEGLVPVWGPHFETSDEFLGTFLLKDNIFHERCRVYINESYEI